MKISENYIDILLILDICRYLFLDISNFGTDILYIFRYLIYFQIFDVYNLSDEQEGLLILLQNMERDLREQSLPAAHS